MLIYFFRVCWLPTIKTTHFTPADPISFSMQWIVSWDEICMCFLFTFHLIPFQNSQPTSKSMTSNNNNVIYLLRQQGLDILLCIFWRMHKQPIHPTFQLFIPRSIVYFEKFNPTTLRVGSNLTGMAHLPNECKVKSTRDLIGWWPYLTPAGMLFIMWTWP